MDIEKIKQRFGILGNSASLHRAIDIAFQVAPTDLSVLISGESGTGKEVFPKIIHKFSTRKHGKYIAVNCGAIPEGTIDSELFGHEKGAFTGATDHRKGYFEVADKGTIFLDEVGELPLPTQVRLLRVLETGEFIKVGSSLVQKTEVRIIAATNLDIPKAINDNKFREDLYYRLNSVPINILPLRERNQDVYLLFRKFAYDFAERYRMPAVKLNEEARLVLEKYRWPGNVRQLKNITEQISVIEQNRDISADTMRKYLPNKQMPKLPALYNKSIDEKTFANEREILYQVLFDMKKNMNDMGNDMNDLKKLVHEIIENGTEKINLTDEYSNTIKNIQNDFQSKPSVNETIDIKPVEEHNVEDTEIYVEESLSIVDKEIELIKKALKKHNGKRKNAAFDLGISERTLYRKIKEYDI
ncbi:MAG: sigma-54-dependent Fis family transcriptional regulator [Bacteroidetes bacterium]|jgi:transcriptional regulator with PAS, ATPase and Fis domain|nr:sigma-54-dependent Fis family transcriptional regulator [Bacteroidota bacterium]MBT6685613.1 sigma-54-dependent Fis family transcriptional regulator [Bacteroidota bacterium]MBT7491384.1 sigma-54-dependent Fis family transcriptional regulator [Bacteroidota bacterium]